jgi:hypothetical protein
MNDISLHAVLGMNASLTREATACQRRVRSKSKQKEGNLCYPINKHCQDKNGLRLRRLRFRKRLRGGIKRREGFSNNRELRIANNELKISKSLTIRNSTEIQNSDYSGDCLLNFYK